MDGNQENAIDQALLLRMGQGDEGALRDFIVRYQDRVYGTVAKMIGNPGPDVEDLAQQVFLRIWKAAPRHRAKAKISTWVMTVTRNLVFTFCTSRASRREVSDVVLDQDMEELRERRESVMERSPREDLAGKELVRAVRLACAHLPMKQRLVVHLRQHEELEFAEIGEILGISELGAKSLMFRARDNLKIRLSEFFTEPK